MNKIVVIGPPGAGKTEFANKLGQILSIDRVYHLDHFFWKPGWVRTTQEERHNILVNLTEKDRWIIEGNFLNSLDDQFARADIVVWLNLGLLTCLYRVIKRYLSYLGKEVPEIAPGSRDKISLPFLISIFSYKIVDSHLIKRKLMRPNSPALIILDNPKNVNAYLEEIKRTSNHI